MSNDRRYVYHHQSQTPQYEYSAYPPQPSPSQASQQPEHYVSPPSHPQQASGRAIRPLPTSQPHASPVQTHYSAPQPTYQPTYSPPSSSYVEHGQPTSQQHWSNDSQWPRHYGAYTSNEPPSSQLPPSDTPFTSGPGRPESSGSDTPKGYASMPPPPQPPPRHQQHHQPLLHPDERRNIAGPSSPSTGTSLDLAGVSRGRDQPADDASTPVPGPAASSTEMNLIKFVDAYRMIIDTQKAALNMPRPGLPAKALDLAAIDDMLEAAAYGVQELDKALAKPPAEGLRIARPKEKPEIIIVDKEVAAAGSAASSTSTGKRQQKGDEGGREGQTCLGCSATSTPEWRRGPMGPRTLCNACGLVYAKLVKRRMRENTDPGPSSGHKSGGNSPDSEEYDD